MEAHPGPRRPARSFWVGITLYFFTAALFALTVPLYALKLGAGPQTIGVIVGLGYLVQLLLAVPGGSMIDRYGAKAPLVFGPFVFAAACIVPIAVPGIVALAVAEILMGVGQILFVVASQAETASLTSRVSRAAGFGVLTAAISAGRTLGPLAGGILINGRGEPAALALAALTAALTGAIMLTRRVAFRGDAGQARAAAARPSVRMVMRLPVGYAFAVGSFAVFGRVVYTTFLPVLLQAHGFRATAIGLATALLGVVTFAVRPALSTIARRMGGVAYASIPSTLATGLGILLLVFHPDWALLIAVTVLLGIGVGLGPPISMSMVVDAVAEHQRALVLGSRLVANRLAQVLGPSALGLVAGALGLRVVFVVAGGGILGLVPVLAVFSRSVAGHAAESERRR